MAEIILDYPSETDVITRVTGEKRGQGVGEEAITGGNRHQSDAIAGGAPQAKDRTESQGGVLPGASRGKQPCQHSGSIS